MADEALNPDVVDCPRPGAKNYSTLVRGGAGGGGSNGARVD